MANTTNNSTTTAPAMSYEQLVALFGEDTAKIMFEQMNATQSGGGSALPFSLIKKISTMGNELGDWGTFVVNSKVEKQDDGSKVVVDKGINLGKDFKFIIVNVAYYYSKWDDAAGRTQTSNFFTDLTSGPKTAVNSYSGDPLPAKKEDKKAAGWKMVKQMGVLVEADGKWVPAILEVSGMLFFTLNEILDSAMNKGLLSGVVNLVTKVESKGATQYIVGDTVKSTFEPLPADIFTNPETAGALSDLTNKLTEYRKAKNGAADTPSAQPQDTEAEDTVEW